jgi:hypothetical protein
LLATKQEIDAQLTTKLEQTAEQVRIAHDQAIGQLAGNHTAKQIKAVREAMQAQTNTTELAEDLMELIHQAFNIMLDIAPNKQPFTTVYMPRTVGREYEKLNNQIIELKRIRQETNTKMKHPQCTYTQPKTHEAQTILEQCPGGAGRPTEWMAALGTAIEDTQKRMNLIRMEYNKEKWAAGRKAFSTKLAKQPKVMNRLIFNKHEENPVSPVVLKDKEGQAHTCSEELIDIMTEHMTEMMAPNGHQKTGRYLPRGNQEARDPQNEKGPWETTGLDTFQLETPAVAGRSTADILSLVMDKETFNSCIKHLAKNKQPGPDGIPNELINSLPGPWHQAIHQLFTLMWIMGETPECWKNSNTVLLYKKNDPMQPANYRPIGLNNTMGKLWSAMVASVMSSYAETMHILSPAQHGFRAQRSTHQALNNLVHTIEDAAIYKQDLYVAYFDFSSAFNMVDHDKLLCIMYDLGFTEDAVDAVKSIYNGATTHISLKGATGPAIQIGKGTIQGDTLSPLLFIIFIEPLSRWQQRDRSRSVQRHHKGLH